MISFEKPLAAPNGAAANFHAVTRAEIGPDADAITVYVSSWPTRQAWLEGHEPVAYAAPRVDFQQLTTCGGFMTEVLSVLIASGPLEGALPSVDQPTQELAAERAAHLVRVQRNTLLAQSDWRVFVAAEDGQLLPAAWRTYRQALRDIPAQLGFPLDVQWPAPPSA